MSLQVAIGIRCDDRYIKNHINEHVLYFVVMSIIQLLVIIDEYSVLGMSFLGETWLNYAYYGFAFINVSLNRHLFLEVKRYGKKN